MWQQNYDPLGGPLSTIVAAAPLIVLLGLLAWRRIPAHVAALAGLAAALIVAVAIIGMPSGMAARAALFGAAYGLFPIGWIVLNVIFLYRLTEARGVFAALQRSITGITADRRLQLLLIAFCFGAFFEGFIAGLLRAYRDYRGLFEDWGYWAPGKGSSIEVDFVLRRGKSLLALEARSGSKIFEADLRGLRAIADLPAIVRRLVVYRGERRQKTSDGIEILPVRSLLAELSGPGLF